MFNLFWGWCFPFWLQDLIIFDLNIEFLVKNYIYSRLEMSRIPKFGPKMMKNPEKKLLAEYFAY